MRKECSCLDTGSSLKVRTIDVEQNDVCGRDLGLVGAGYGMAQSLRRRRTRLWEGLCGSVHSFHLHNRVRSEALISV